MTKKIEKELLNEFVKIDENLTKKKYSSKELDNLLEIFLTQLSSNSKVSKKNQLNLLENLDSLKASKESKAKKEKKLSSKDLELKALSQLRKLYYFDEPIDNFQAQALQNRANIALDLIDIDKLQETEEEDFIEFLELLLRRKKQNSSYKIDRISDIQIEESVQKANKRLNSYFQDTGVKTKIRTKQPKRKSYDEIIESINNNDGDFDIPENYLNTFFVALRNTHLGQSDLNRIKSLVKSGSDMKEAIYSVITNKSKRSSIERLVRKHQAMAIKLDEARKRLY